ncbi:hypothetical protein C2I36_00705 [Rhodobacteraceae bacterium WD3A24]|nr:hypothetical protein C2I36_00705 [Rhodobacteraceae bacterium WD3A24]
MSEKRERRQTAIGLVGAVIAALCCVTPVLVVLFGALGLSAALGWIDYVLLPALAFFIALTVQATRARYRRLNAQRKG